MNHNPPNKGLTIRETPCKPKTRIDSLPQPHSDKLTPALCELRRYPTGRGLITTKGASLHHLAKQKQSLIRNEAGNGEAGEIKKVCLGTLATTPNKPL